MKQDLTPPEAEQLLVNGVGKMPVHILFEQTFQTPWSLVSGSPIEATTRWTEAFTLTAAGFEPKDIEEGCVYLCGIIESVLRWRASKNMSS